MHCIGLGVQVGDDGARRNGEAVAGKNPYSAKGPSTPMKPGEQAKYYLFFITKSAQNIIILGPSVPQSAADKKVKTQKLAQNTNKDLKSM